MKSITQSDAFYFFHSASRCRTHTDIISIFINTCNRESFLSSILLSFTFTFPEAVFLFSSGRNLKTELHNFVLGYRLYQNSEPLMSIGEESKARILTIYDYS